MRSGLPWLILALAGSLAAQVKITALQDRVSVEIDGKPYTDFYVRGPEVTKPYLHPLRSASGKIVTRRFPMEKVAGEPTDHPHQRGLWFAHDSVNGYDFWNNEASYNRPKLGHIVLEKIDSVTSGKRSGTIRATFSWNDTQGKQLLREDRTMTFYSNPALRIIDFDIALTAVEKVVFGDSKDGAFGLRINPDLEEAKHSGTIVNAEGAEHEKNVWGKPSEWVDYYGETGGEKLGIAIFDHPSNPRHPVRWHVRGYGLFAANPFGLSCFTGDKTQDGSLTLEPAKSVRFRYRVVIHPGDDKSAGIAGLYKEYTEGK